MLINLLRSHSQVSAIQGLDPSSPYPKCSALSVMPRSFFLIGKNLFLQSLELLEPLSPESLFLEQGLGVKVQDEDRLELLLLGCICSQAPVTGRVQGTWWLLVPGNISSAIPLIPQISLRTESAFHDMRKRHCLKAGWGGNR